MPLLVFPLTFAVGPLLPVLGFLLGRAGAVGTRDILFLLGFGLHLVVGRFRPRCLLEGDAIDKQILKIIHKRAD